MKPANLCQRTARQAEPRQRLRGELGATAAAGVCAPTPLDYLHRVWRHTSSGRTGHAQAATGSARVRAGAFPPRYTPAGRHGGHVVGEDGTRTAGLPISLDERALSPGELFLRVEETAIIQGLLISQNTIRKNQTSSSLASRYDK
jgi:hypothetical protein